MSEKLTYRATNTRTCVKKRKRSIGKTLYGKQIVQKKLKVIKKKRSRMIPIAGSDRRETSTFVLEHTRTGA
jgi:hypothetical protein